MNNKDIRGSLETVVTNLENMSPTTPVVESLAILRPIVLALGGRTPLTREQADRLTALRAKRALTLTDEEEAGLDALEIAAAGSATVGTAPVGTVTPGTKLSPVVKTTHRTVAGTTLAKKTVTGTTPFFK